MSGPGCECLAEGYTCKFCLKAGLNIALSETQSKKAENTSISPRTNGLSAARRCEAPLTERPNTMEGLFPAERAKGGAGDGRPPDGAEDSGDSRREDDGIEGLSKIKYSRSAKRATLIFYHRRVFTAKSCACCGSPP